jgi:hypothetical protein
VAYFDALKSTKLNHKAASPGTNESWENVGIPTLESLSRASETFKTPKKLKLGPILSLANVPFTNSRIKPMPFIETLPKGASMELADRHIQHGIQIVMADWNKLEANFELIQLELDSGF